jgi:uncharacterized membrane-anchored protein
LFAEKFELGYLNSGLMFLGAIGIISLLYRFGTIKENVAFWLAYILTRPLRASFGDLLSQAKSAGGLGFGTTATTIAFVVAIAIAVSVSKADGVRSD